MTNTHGRKGTAAIIVALLGTALVTAAAIASTTRGTTCTMGFCADDPLTATDGETPWRYVGVQLDGAEACPAAEGWQESKVFDFSPDVTPKGLQPYCLYVWPATATRGPGPDPTPILGLVDVDGPLVQADPDIMVVSYMAALKESLVDPLRDHLHAQAGRPAVVPSGLASEVRLALLDTQPDSDTPITDPAATSAHGHGLIHLVSELACAGDPACNIRIATHLALPWTCAADASCSDVSGGFMGTPVDVAQSIARAIVQWQQPPPAGGEHGLVVNLSLGWDPLFNDCAGPCARAPLERVAVQVMRRALELAACRGALVIAAAGNPIPGPVTSTGPLLPGGFEAENAPGFAECEVLLDGSIPPDDEDFGPAPRPLVYAAGAVAADGSAIQSRPGGEPALVAFGDHAVARAADGTATATQTGTSVASAVVAAAAASAWAFRSDLAGWQIMDELYLSGLGLDRDADFCRAAPCPEVQRVTVCRSVERICAAGGGDCPPPTAFGCSDPLPREPILPLAAIEAEFGPVSLDVATFTSTVVPQCASPGTTYRIFHDAVPVDWCPDRQYFGAQATPWAGGQPGNNNCEDCVSRFRSPGMVFLEVDAGFDTQHAAIVCTPSPGTVHAYSLANLGELLDGERFVIANLPQNCIDNGLALTGRIDNPDHASSVRTTLLVNTDPDSDGVPAALDNCSLTANADQRDTDGDGIGNRCDTDLNNDCLVNFADLSQFKTRFFTTDANADFTGDGMVNFADLAIMVASFLGSPGPTGPVTDCDPGIWSSGSLDVSENFAFDLDTGTTTPATDPPADIWFMRKGPEVALLIPQNGALHAIFGNDLPTRADCAATVVDDQPIDVDATGLELYVCSQTSAGRLNRYRIVAASAFPPGSATELTIEFVTWE